jgi:ppGpp synthetase/RelA/SpoT-type nucleotidyltranferase
MEQTTQGELEARVRLARPEVVSNMNDLRTGQLMGLIEAANREKAFLQSGKRIILAERNPEYLNEILAKILPEFCPNNLFSYQNHHLPHYTVRDGRVETYTNLDASSPVAMVQARVKHPCSLAEKVSRKAEYFGRVSEYHDRHKLMVGDVTGLELGARRPEDVPEVSRRLLALPYLKLEHFESHRKKNGYTSDHFNFRYENGNPLMKGLEIEVQVTDMNSHRASIEDDKQGHDTSYGAEKLASKHRLPDANQLIVFGNSVEVPQSVGVQQAGELLVARIKGPQEYLLVVPRGN